jgi:predicted metal-dependent phosphoesterase TrpH
MNVLTEIPVRVELHLHTSASIDSLVGIEKLLQHCEKIGIDRVAITDHNVIEAALEAKALAPERVIVGEEIETTQGELIGYFMTEWVPPALEPLETISRLRAQGAVISVPHPFDTARGPRWQEADLLAVIPHVDAIETFNARCLSNGPNERAAAFAREHGLLKTVGSDAHSLYEVGRASLMMQGFNDAESFKTALRDAEPMTNLSPVFVHFFSRFAVFKKTLKKVLHSNNR